MKNQAKVVMEKNGDIIFTAIPVEHLIVNSIDRLGNYLLVHIPFLQLNDYQTAVELNDEEKKLISILVSNRDFMKALSNLQYCTLFIQKRIDDKNVEQIIFDVERACDFLVISQYRYDRREWFMGKPGAIGPYLIAFNINIMTKSIEPFYQENHFFNEIQGLGLEVSFSPLSQEKTFYPALFSKRTDEVYMTCRYYITKACRTFTIPSLQSTFSELFSTLEGIGMIGCLQFTNFTIENKRIMAVNCSNQNEYERKLDTFCFYSEVMRTLVLHQGHSLLEFMDRKSVFRLFTSIFWEIITFAINLINTEIHDLCDINTYIENKMDLFLDHVSSIKTSFILKNEERGINGDRDVYIFPILDLMLDEYIKLGKLLIIPTGFLNECRHDKVKCLGLSDFFIDRMLDDNLIEQNNNTIFVLFKGDYQMNQFDTTESSWQYIDDICGEIQNMLVPLFIQRDAIPNRNNFWGAVGVYNGIRGGFIYDSALDEIISICGRVYSLYNSTKSPFMINNTSVDTEIIDIICSGKRNDEVAIGCKSALLTLGKAMREDDMTYMLMDMFDAVDKIYPIEFNMVTKWKWIASFAMDKRSEYDKYYSRLRAIGSLYRTPLYHYGKKAVELFSKEAEIYLLFNEVKEFLIKCAKKMYSSGIVSWNSLKIYRNNIMSH